MTIITMSKLRAIAPLSALRPLLQDLSQSGCVEIDSSAEHLVEEEWSGLLERYADPSDADRDLGLLASARDLLDKYAPVKAGFLAPRRQVSESQFQDDTNTAQANDAAAAINELGRQIAACISDEGRLSAKKASLLPWQGLDVPLDIRPGKSYRIAFGVSPAAGTPATELVDEAASKELAELRHIGSDREQHYFMLITHADVYDEMMDDLKAKGFSQISFKDVEGAAADNILDLETRLAEAETQKLELIEKIKALAENKAAIEQAIDRQTIESKRDQILSGLAATKKTSFLEGWIPKAAEADVAHIMESYGCAYGFEAPDEGEEAPILLQNNRYVEPFTMVTELYSLPTYSSGLDPNPFMAPFYFVFFGLMMADIGYGLVITFGAMFALKKARPPEGGIMRRLMQLMVYCGISTAVWGLLFGSFFGDAVSAFSGKILGMEVALKPLLFDPLADPMTLFILSLVFGYVQIMLGLGLNAYKLMKHGKTMDAVYDVIFWMVILLGVPACLLNITIGLVLMGIGALGVLLFAGRDKKNIFSRIVGGLGALYGATGYLSDILSYSRLLALGLASAVIAQVMNTMGTLGGRSVVGFILFVVVFVIGHVFNIAINILGTFVHTSRLQFIEFFSKFFDAGGRAFNPLYYKTKYVEIIKEAK